MEDDGSLDKLPGKEGAAIKRQMNRMKRNFEGMLNLKGVPGALFVIDSHNEAIAIAEANRLKIPVIALVDSNSDPSLINFPIPGNDDSTKSIRIIVDVILDAIQAGASRRVEAPTRRKDITPLHRSLILLIKRMNLKSHCLPVTRKLILMTVVRKRRLSQY